MCERGQISFRVKTRRHSAVCCLVASFSWGFFYHYSEASLGISLGLLRDLISCTSFWVSLLGIFGRLHPGVASILSVLGWISSGSCCGPLVCLLLGTSGKSSRLASCGVLLMLILFAPMSVSFVLLGGFLLRFVEMQGSFVLGPRYTWSHLRCALL